MRLGPALALIATLVLAAPSPGQAQTAPGPISGPISGPIDEAALIAAATAGDTEAQWALAQAYHSGNGLLQDYVRAAQWAARAAAAGDARAQNLLGRYYHQGRGVEQDQIKALQWLAEAANTGTPAYLFDIGKALETGADGSSDPEKAAMAYAAAAAKGHMDATTSLGLLYQDGRGVEQDYQRAHDLYQTAAKAGDARAQNNLGLLYVRGHGVAQDYTLAAELFAAAAAQGLGPALRNLGVMYDNGYGVPVDEARAAELYRQAGWADPNQATAESHNAGTDIGANTRTGTGALVYDPRLQPPTQDIAALSHQANAGDPVARFQLAWLLATDPDADHSALKQAAALFRSAAEAGHPPSMINLGVLYFQGLALPQDYMLGQMWLTLAARSGLPQAQAALARFGPQATPTQVQQAQALARPWLDKWRPSP